MFLVSQSIAIVNLVLDIKNIEQSFTGIKITRAGFDRINLLSSCLLALRSIVNMANNYEPSKTLIAEDRFKTYIDILEDRTNRLKDA